MRVFIAGASGAIGRALIPALRSAGHDVIGLTSDARKGEALRALGVEPVTGDALDAASVAAAIERARPDAVTCQLTRLPQRPSPWEISKIYRENDRVRLEGTRNLLAAARASGVRRFVAQSIAFWYRPDPGGGGAPRTEDAPLWTDAGEPIGAAARVIESVERDLDAARDISTCALRYGALYGPGTYYSPGGAVFEDAGRRRFPIVGAGLGILSFVHVDDAAAATVAALGSTARGAFNIVDDEPLAARDWVPLLARAAGGAPPRRLPQLLARVALPGGFVRWQTASVGASNARARCELGFVPRFPRAREGLLDQKATAYSR